MELVIINAFFYLIILSLYWRWKKVFDLGFILLLAYTSIAVIAIPHHYYLNITYKRDITLMPFVYFIFVLLLFIRPYLKTDVSLVILKKLKTPNIYKLKILTYLFVVASGFAIYALLPQAILNIQLGKWNEVRNELYTGEAEVLYSNAVERIMMIYIQYFRVVAVLIFFYFLSSKSVKSFLIILLGLSIIIPSFLTAINTASRGAIVNVFFEFISAFIIFRHSISKVVKKYIYIYSTVFIGFFVVYSLAVTASRFGEVSNDYGSNMSLIDYFGQPMLVFNSGVSSLFDYAYGSYFMNFFLEPLNITSTFSQQSAGGSWGNSFFTFLGSIYIDWGPFGTLILSIILPYLISLNLKGRNISFGNLFLYFFFYIFFLEGVFVIGYSFVIPLLFAVLTYIYLKF